MDALHLPMTARLVALLQTAMAIIAPIDLLNPEHGQVKGSSEIDSRLIK